MLHYTVHREIDAEDDAAITIPHTFTYFTCSDEDQRANTGHSMYHTEKYLNQRLITSNICLSHAVCR